MRRRPRAPSIRLRPVSRSASNARTPRVDVRRTGLRSPPFRPVRRRIYGSRYPAGERLSVPWSVMVLDGSALARSGWRPAPAGPARLRLRVPTGRLAGAARRPGDRRPAGGHLLAVPLPGGPPGRGAVVPQGGRVLQPLLRPRASGGTAPTSSCGPAGGGCGSRRPPTTCSTRWPPARAAAIVPRREARRAAAQPGGAGVVAVPAHGATGLRDARLRRRPGRGGASVAPPTWPRWRPTPTTTPRPCCGTRTSPGATTPTSWPGGLRCYPRGPDPGAPQRGLIRATRASAPTAGCRRSSAWTRGPRRSPT